jgi:hypothetical protein
MGWSVDRDKYNFVLAHNNNTLPNPKGLNSVPSCIVVCTQKSYKVFGENPGEEISLGGWQIAFHNKSEWKVVNSRVQTVRYYAASTAKVTLAIDLKELDGKIPPPGLTYNDRVKNKKFRADNYHQDQVIEFAGPYSKKAYEEQTYEIRPEMQIEIYMGYVNNLENNGLTEEFDINTQSYSYTVDPRFYTKVFNGIIDSVDLKLGKGDNPNDGVTCTVVARDNIRYLLDNKFFGMLAVKDSNGNLVDFSSSAGVDRTRIVQALVEQGSAGQCKIADPDLFFHPSGRPSMKINSLYETEEGQKTAGLVKGQTPILAGAGVPFQIADQVPVDAIRWFSQIETLPRELYCEIESGDIAWTIRMLGEPYRTSPDGTLFGAIQVINPEAGVSYNPNTVVSSDLKGIIYKLLKNTRADRILNYEPSDAETLLRVIQQEYDAYAQREPLLRTIYPLSVLLGQIYLESGFNPYVDVDIERNIAYTNELPRGRNPVIENRNRANPFNPGGSSGGASGFTQILLYTHWGGANNPGNGVAARVTNGNFDLFVDYSRRIDSSKIPQPVIYYLRCQLELILSYINILRDPYSRRRIDTASATLLATRFYISRNVSAWNTLVNSGRNFSYNDYTNIADASASTEVIRYVPRVVEAQRKFSFASGDTNYTAEQPSQPTAAVNASSEVSDKSKCVHGIEILRGEKDPWLYSYKRTVRSFVNGQQKTVYPNIISAKSSWTTLGVITKFTLVHPANSKSTGNINVRSQHSLFGNPLQSLANSPEKSNLKKVFRASTGLPDYSKYTCVDPSASSAAAQETLSSLTRDDEEEMINPQTNQISADGVNAPLKFLSKIRFPVRHRYLWDESSDSTISDKVCDLILNAMMNIYGQDIQSIDFVAPLNPDIRPGHVVQVHNMGFYDQEQFRVEGVIHMFASGGVQNGCTTMIVGVSKQASQDPVEAVKLLEEIAKLQSMSIIGLKTSDIGSSIKNSSGSAPNLNMAAATLNAAKAFNRGLARRIDYRYLVGFFHDNYAKNVYDNLTPESKSSFTSLDDMKSQANVLFYNYCFNYLATFLGEIVTQDVYESNSTSGWPRQYNIDIKRAHSELSSFLTRLQSTSSDPQYAISKNVDTLMRAIPTFNEFKSFIKINAETINFRKNLGLCPQGLIFTEELASRINTNTVADFTKELDLILNTIRTNHVSNRYLSFVENNGPLKGCIYRPGLGVTNDFSYILESPTQYLNMSQLNNYNNYAYVLQYSLVAELYVVFSGWRRSQAILEHLSSTLVNLSSNFT